MVDDFLDKDDIYKPISFSRNYYDEPIKVMPYWIHSVEVKKFLGKYDLSLDLLGVPAITGPNGSGKTILLKLIYAVIEAANGWLPNTLSTLTKQVYIDAYDGAYIEYSHLFDKVVVTTVDGHTYQLITENYSNGTYQLIKDGEVYQIVDGQFDTAPSDQTGIEMYLLKTGRVAAPDAYLFQLLRMTDGKPDIDFIDRWFNYLVNDINPDDDSARVHRYNNIPNDNTLSAKKMCDSLKKWIVSSKLSHGELELLLHLLAMSSKSNIVMVDDAEIGFHPTLQSGYMYLVSSLYKNGIQVLFSTHSPTMFDMNFHNSNDLYMIAKPAK